MVRLNKISSKSLLLTLTLSIGLSSSMPVHAGLGDWLKNNWGKLTVTAIVGVIAVCSSIGYYLKCQDEKKRREEDERIEALNQQREKDFLEAIQNNDTNRVQQILATRKHLWKSKDALNTVTEKNQTDMLRLLIDHSKDQLISMWDINYALREHMTSNNGGSIKLLIQAGANVQDPALLITAVTKGNVVAVEALLTAGANINANFNTPHANTALETAISYNNVEIARLLLSKGAKIDKDAKKNQDYLAFAASNGYEDMVKFLLDEVKVNPAYPNPLERACKNGHLNIVKMLIAAKAPVEAGHIPPLLIQICPKGDTKIVQALIEARADIHEKHLYTSAFDLKNIYPAPVRSLLIAENQRIIKEWRASKTSTAAAVIPGTTLALTSVSSSSSLPSASSSSSSAVSTATSATKR